MTMKMPPISDFIMWAGLEEASGNYKDFVDPSRAFTRESVAQVAGLSSEYGGDFEQGTPSKCYIADAAWNTFGDESITIGAWIKPETFLAEWDSGGWNYELSAIISKAISLNDHEYFLGFDASKRPVFHMSDGVSHGWDDSAIGALNSITNGNKALILGGYDADANEVFVKVYNAAGALVTSDTTAASPGFGTSADSVPLWIGGQQETAAAGDGTHHWDGVIDEPFIYRGIFSADEESWIVNGGDGRQYSDLIVGGIPIFF